MLCFQGFKNIFEFHIDFHKPFNTMQPKWFALGVRLFYKTRWAKIVWKRQKEFCF